jgi:N utilization substance protein B
MTTSSPNLLQGRRVARKFALLALYQLEASRGSLPAKVAEDKSLTSLIRSSAQTLVLHAQDDIEAAADLFKSVSEQIMTAEFEHPTNLNSSFDAPQVAVPLPSTQDTLHSLDKCLLACEWVWNVLAVPQMLVHLEDQHVEDYATHMIACVCEHNDALTEKLEAYTADWKTDRLIKMDRLILKLALAEILYEDGLDYGVSVNEAVELAKAYSLPESYKFINGVLGKIVQDLKNPPAESVEEAQAEAETSPVEEEASITEIEA